MSLISPHSTPALVWAMTRELLGRPTHQRTPEPDLVMDDPAAVAAYLHAGRIDGCMAGYYLFASSVMAEIIEPGSVVLDLGCGPATLLCSLAAAHPKSQFIGVDLSSQMLSLAKKQCTERGLTNVEFVQDDITSLEKVKSHQADCVVSSVALHHLPDAKALTQTFRAISASCKPGVKLRIMDFGQLKLPASIEYLVARNAPMEHPLFIQDYRYSLQAAFSVETWRASLHEVFPDARVVHTAGVPAVLLAATPSSGNHTALWTQAKARARLLLPKQRQDFTSLCRLFEINRRVGL